VNSSSAFCRAQGKLPLQGWVSEWFPISWPAATACFQPARRDSMAEGTTKNVTFAPRASSTARPVSTWLARASSKLRLSAARAPLGQATRAAGGAGAAAISASATEISGKASVLQARPLTAAGRFSRADR
jgi:hypothetical protein